MFAASSDNTVLAEKYAFNRGYQHLVQYTTDPLKTDALFDLMFGRGRTEGGRTLCDITEG